MKTVIYFIESVICKYELIGNLLFLKVKSEIYSSL